MTTAHVPINRINLNDHEQHAALLYFPSDVYRLESEEEFIFFKTKWKNKSDKECVKRIYDSFARKQICPCRLLVAFNIFNASSYTIRNSSNDNDDRIKSLPFYKNKRNDFVTNMEFSNEYQLNTTFFQKRSKQDVKIYNVEYAKHRLRESVYDKCIFIERNVSKKRKYEVKQNKRKQEKFENVRNTIARISRKLRHRVRVIRKNLLRPDLSLDEKRKLFKRFRRQCQFPFMQIDYFKRFNYVLLQDVNMYVSKMPKNKVFKTKLNNALAKMVNDCRQFWGIDDLRRKQEVEEEEWHGQYVPMNDNQSHRWYRLQSVCKHDGGFDILHHQTRCNDELVTTIKFCKLCSRKILV